MYKLFTDFMKQRGLLQSPSSTSPSLSPQQQHQQPQQQQSIPTPSTPTDPDETLMQLYSSYPRRSAPLAVSADGVSKI